MAPKKRIHEYDKSIDVSKFKERVGIAIQNAKAKDSPPCEKWPATTGSTIYRLVENILAKKQR